MPFLLRANNWEQITIHASLTGTEWMVPSPILHIVIDNEADTEFAIVDFEFGWMMSKRADVTGHSFYVRPSVGVGADRPTDGSIEVGYKIVG